MTMKEAHDILAAAKDRNALRAALHTHFGYSVDAARAQTKLWFDAPAEATPEKKELTRADIARTFRDDRTQKAKRLAYLKFMVQDAARNEWRATTGGFGTLGEAERLRDAIADRMARELEAELDGCKTRDAREAKLVRLEWSEDSIAGYLDEHGPPT